MTGDNSKWLLTNQGMVIINDKISEKRKTVIVVGCARGGTSIVSGVLSSLGLFMGNTSCPPVYEDTELANAFENRDDQAVTQIVGAYDSRHEVWGFKRPSNISYLSEIHLKVRNPRYIFIFKDVLAIGNRNLISMQVDLIENMRVALQNYQRALEFILAIKPAAMLVSAEKLLQHKAHFINELCGFIGLQVDGNAIQRAKDFIEPDPLQYLENTRITKAIGCIDAVSDNEIKGWAKLIHSDKPPLLEVYINDRLIAQAVPNIFRQDLLDKGIHKSGHAGFRIVIGQKITKGDLLRIRAKNDVRDIFIRQF